MDKNYTLVIKLKYTKQDAVACALQVLKCKKAQKARPLILHMINILPPTFYVSFLQLVFCSAIMICLQ